MISHLLKSIDEPRYLEIGCRGNTTFNTIPALTKVGVDPVSGGTHRETSDEFFAKNQSTFNLIFIDGLHLYDQVHRDLENSLSCIEIGGYIVLHDMLPLNWREEFVPQFNRRAWTGDVWKVAFELIDTKDIDFQIILVDHGVGVIKVKKKGIELQNSASFLFDKRFKYLFENISKLPLKSFENFLKKDFG